MGVGSVARHAGAALPVAATLLAALAGPGAAAGVVWDLATVLPLGAEVPDRPGARIREVGRLYAVNAETFAVWARLDGPAPGWWLLGVRPGKIETLGVERVGNDSGGGELLALKRQEAGVGARLGQSVVAGQGLVYLQEKPLEPVPAGGRNPIYVWDGRGRRRLLGPGDELSFRGTVYRCATATLGNANASGTVLIAFSAASPTAMGLAVHDGKGLRVLMTDDQPLPGTASSRFKDAALGCGEVRLEEAVLGDDGSAVLVGYLKGEGGTRKGILAVSETSTEILVGGGDPCPVPVGGKVRSCPFAVFDARSASLVVASFTCREPVAAIWDGRQWLPMETGDLAVDQAVLLARDVPAAVWHGAADRQERRGGEVKRLHAEGWGLFAGGGSRDLRFMGNNPTGFELVSGGAETPGILLQYGWGVQGFPDRFVDARAPGNGAGAAPSFPASVGGSVLLGDVLAWLGNDTALVVVRGPGFKGPNVSPGIYLMRRAAAATP